MDYKEAKKLLFDENVKLDYKKAEEILELMNKPRMFALLLKADNERIRLKRYSQFNERDLVHEFSETEIETFSYKVVKKFFEIKDDDISLLFIESLSNNICKKHCVDMVYVYMWPYFSYELLNLTTFAMLEALIFNNYFVFDFASDKTGKMFEKLVNLTECDDFSKELLAINSFNIDEFVERLGLDTQIDALDLARLSAYSSHYFFFFSDLYGVFRKMLISYLEFAVKAQNFYLNQQNKANGIIFN